MIFITGDTHGDVSRFFKVHFKIQEELSKKDYVIILGDFGLIWDYTGENAHEHYELDELNDRSFTTVFIDGNHENFTRLNNYPVIEWNGGKVHQIRDSIFHLMRGEVFNIDGSSFFAFGGAHSHDINGFASNEELQRDYTAGVLRSNDPRFHEKVRECRKRSIFYRVEGISWWKEEAPSREEMENGRRNLESNHHYVDYVLSHDCPASCLPFLSWTAESDEVSRYLEEVKQKTTYKQWFFGHYHINKTLPTGEQCLYRMIHQIS